MRNYLKGAPVTINFKCKPPPPAPSPEEGVYARLAEVNENALTADGHENAFAGIVYRFGQDPIAAYDRAAVIQNLMGQGMTEEDAEEYFDFNIIGSFVGDGTPCFIELAPKAERLVDVLYRLARHVRNTDKIAAREWGVRGCDLLAELREIDPERYDAEVKSDAEKEEAAR